MKSILQYVTPKIFLENFNSLEYELSKLSWPKKPKYILTSYPYYEEVFKYYCAKNKMLGSKVIITQHGYDNIFKYEDWFPNKINPVTNTTCREAFENRKKQPNNVTELEDDNIDYVKNLINVIYISLLIILFLSIANKYLKK